MAPVFTGNKLGFGRSAEVGAVVAGPLTRVGTILNDPLGTNSSNSPTRTDSLASSLRIALPFYGPNGNTSFSEGLADVSGTIRGASNLTLASVTSAPTISSSFSKQYGVSGDFYNGGTRNKSMWVQTDQLKPGSSDFTWECWLYVPTTPAESYFLWHQTNTNTNTSSGGSQGSLGIQLTASRTIYIYDQGSCITSNNEVSSAQTWNVGEWFHLACSRNGSGFRCYINGNITTHNGEATRSISGSFRNVNYHNIGRYAGNSSDPSSAFFGGYMSDLRMYIGAYKYWDAFTPY
jgi:hypothetical protein